MTHGGTCVIVGASLAGATTALTLRELGYDGSLLLVGDERELPYERPALSKEYLLGTMSVEQMRVRSRQDYDDLRIELRLGQSAVALDTEACEVVLDGAERLAYSNLVIATGASNVRPAIPGLGLPGVYQLRTLREATALKAAAESAQRVVVVGMGFIGCEIASSLRALGLAVTAVDELAGPLLPQLGPHLSERVGGWHSEHGVQMLFGRSVSAITNASSGLTVTTTHGDVLPADLVVVGVGVRPNVAWLGESPLVVPAGVRVDADGRTDLPDVFAAGDVAATWHARSGQYRRTEHWSNAIEQGRTVAHTMLGLVPPPRPAPYFWSAQYGHYLQYVGEHTPGAELLVRESAGRITAFYVDDATVVAAVTIDNGRELRHARALVGRRVDVRELVDPAVDVRALAARQPA